MDSYIFESGQNHCSKWRVSVKDQNRTANSVDPNEMAHDEPSHLDLHCLHRYMY